MCLKGVKIDCFQGGGVTCPRSPVSSWSSENSSPGPMLTAAQWAEPFLPDRGGCPPVHPS